jgi:hypothetical protein
MGWKVQGSNPSSSKILMSSPEHPDQLCSHQASSKLIGRRLYLQGKGPGGEVNHSPPSSTTLKNERGYTSTPPKCPQFSVPGRERLFLLTTVLIRSVTCTYSCPVRNGVFTGTYHSSLSSDKFKNVRSPTSTLFCNLAPNKRCSPLSFLYTSHM